MINPVKNLINKIREINQKYSKPKIQMSRPVKFALLALRLYLVFLIAMLLYKFITLLH
ncbi:MAG: hypothetical protein ABSF44_09115 [Candidatus Bathyarchaeia archaeon]